MILKRVGVVDVWLHSFFTLALGQQSVAVTLIPASSEQEAV